MGSIKNHRYPHSELNGVEDDNGEIPYLTIQGVKKPKKITLNGVVSQINSRDPIQATQRAGRKRRQGQCEPLEHDTIEVNFGRPIRRRRTGVKVQVLVLEECKLEHLQDRGTKALTVK
jgi:hypothetical protein